MVEVILYGAITGCNGKLFELEDQIIPRRYICLTPDIAHVASQPTHEEGADEVDRKGHRPVPALMLPALKFRSVGHPPWPRHLADKPDRISNSEIAVLCVRILYEAQIHHELLPVVSLAPVPEALKAREDVIHSHQIDNGVHHTRQLQALKRRDVFHHRPPPINAQHKSDVANVDRVAQGERPLGIGVGQVQLRDYLLNAVRDVEIGGLVTEIGRFAIIIGGDGAIPKQIRGIIDPRGREKRGSGGWQRAVARHDVGPAHIRDAVEKRHLRS